MEYKKNLKKIHRSKHDSDNKMNRKVQIKQKTNGDHYCIASNRSFTLSSYFDFNASVHNGVFS